LYNFAESTKPITSKVGMGAARQSVATTATTTTKATATAAIAAIEQHCSYTILLY
jgi:hypothetical protein